MSFSPNLGRWLQQDPTEYVDGMNLYRAFDDSPTERLDPSGQFSLQIEDLGVQLGDCGEFNWRVEFKILPGAGQRGYVIQHVTYTTTVYDCHDDLIRFDTGDYWEAFTIPNGEQYATNTDHFHQDFVKCCTQGRTTMHGFAQYYEPLDLPASFVPNSMPEAGELPATKQDPHLAGALSSASHEITVKWDCCSPGRPCPDDPADKVVHQTEVVEKRIRNEENE